MIVVLLYLASSGSKQLEISSSKIDRVSDYQKVKNNVTLIIKNFNNGLEILMLIYTYMAIKDALEHNKIELDNREKRFHS